METIILIILAFLLGPLVIYALMRTPALILITCGVALVWLMRAM